MNALTAAIESKDSIVCRAKAVLARAEPFIKERRVLIVGTEEDTDIEAAVREGGFSAALSHDICSVAAALGESPRVRAAIVDWSLPDCRTILAALERAGIPRVIYSAAGEVAGRETLGTRVVEKPGLEQLKLWLGGLSA